MRVKDQRADRFIIHILWRRHTLDDLLEDLLDIDTFLGGDAQNRIRFDPKQGAYIFSHFIGTG